MSRRSNNDTGITIALYAALFGLLIILAGSCGAMTPESKAINAAEDAGYTNVKIVDKAIFGIGLRGCGKEDNARFTVRGTNPRGEERTFYVCAGVLKGGTIRSRQQPWREAPMRASGQNIFVERFGVPYVFSR